MFMNGNECLPIVHRVYLFVFLPSNHKTFLGKHCLLVKMGNSFYSEIVHWEIVGLASLQLETWLLIIFT